MREQWRTFIQRAANLFRRRRLEHDLDAEMRSHLEMAVDANLGKGLNAEEARRFGVLAGSNKRGNSIASREVCHD